ncbi:cell envelope integrity protein CreD [Robiginitomaculum antarcticum]|uniref:cell envelope integrity protein CreD n=1 Tax=Robiginitomaculum antarcticum TaxID=437507 RepID=UPI0014612FB1|nr:cell envelope integrity protein CreD [Robiginitomaculum antarcticum]
MSKITTSGGRSVGLKLLVVCALVLLMGIPALFISLIAFERSDRANEVTREVSQNYGGEQTLLGPIWVVPYSETGAPDEDGKRRVSTGEYVIFADSGEVDIPALKTEEKKLSLYRVTTFQAEANFRATFTRPEVLPGNVTMHWEDSRILLGISDVRGLRDDVFLTMPDSEKLKFAPALGGALSNMRAARADIEPAYTQKFRGVSEVSGLQFMEVPIGRNFDGETLNVAATLPIKGAGRIAIVPFAQSTKSLIAADWPHPSFKGQFPPVDRTITDDGFSAQWSVPLLARGIPGAGPAHSIGLERLTQSTMEVSLVQLVTPYQKVNRALKYAIMFIGLVFLGYFLFEVLLGQRVHPAQYVLIGLAQCIFYLLLLAFAEHVGFAAAFLIAAAAVVGVTSAYAGAVFGAGKYALRAGAIFAGIYSLLFVLMQIEDLALLIGAVTSFLAIAGTMYLTRNINWYSSGEDS